LKFVIDSGFALNSRALRALDLSFALDARSGAYRPRAVADPGGPQGAMAPQTMVKFFFTLSYTNH